MEVRVFEMWSVTEISYKDRLCTLSGGTVLSRELCLVDRVTILHAGSRGSCPNDFSNLVDQDIRTQRALS